MKRILLLMTAILLLAISFAGCNDLIESEKNTNKKNSDDIEVGASDDEGDEHLDGAPLPCWVVETLITDYSCVKGFEVVYMRDIDMYRVEFDTDLLISDLNYCDRKSYMLDYDPEFDYSDSPVTTVNNAQFEELAAQHNDSSYRHVVLSDIGSTLFVDKIKSMNIVSDQDYDNEHPAGTSLNDIAVANFVDCEEFIKNGYDIDKTYENFDVYVANATQKYGAGVIGGYEGFVESVKSEPTDMAGYLPKVLYFSEINEQSTKFMNSRMLHFRMLKEPTLSKTHNLTLTIEMGDKSFSNSFETTWE